MKQLGRVFIETWVEVPTKLVKGEQRYKFLKSWVQIPHELVDVSTLRRLKMMAETTDDGVVEVTIEAKQYKDSSMPRYYKVRGVVQTIITVASA